MFKLEDVIDVTRAVCSVLGLECVCHVTSSDVEEWFACVVQPLSGQDYVLQNQTNEGQHRQSNSQ